MEDNKEATTSETTTATEPKFELNVDKFKEAVLSKDKQENFEYLNDVVKHLFDPNQPLPDYSYDSDIFKCFFGGASSDELATTIESLSSGKYCFRTLNEEYAFRCLTCSPDSPRSILCAECYRNGDHKDHEVILKRTSYNAYCDCGDSCMVSEKGFCKKHTEGRKDIPDESDAIKCAEFILPHYIYRLLQFLREEDVIEKFDQSFLNNFDSDFCYNSIYSPLSTFLSNFNNYIDTLDRFSKAGDAFRRKIIKCLVDKDFYELKIAEEVCLAADNAEPKKYGFIRLDQKLIERTVGIKYPDELLTLNLVDVQFKSMLDEIVFSWIMLKTPDRLTDFLVNLLLEKDFIIPLSRSLLSAYVLTDFLAGKYHQGYSYSSSDCNITKMTRKLFGNKEYAEKFSKELNLLETIAVAIYNLYKTPTVVNTTSESGTNEVVECNHALITTKSMLLPLDDFFKIVNKPTLARILLSNEKLFSVWVNLLSYLEGMAPYTRKFVEHEEYESEIYKYSFDLEKLQSSAVLYSLLNSYNDSIKVDDTKKALEKINSNLFKWLDGLPSKGGLRPNKNRLTFHLPLHRYYSGFIYKALHVHNVPLADVLTKDQTKLLDLLGHPLQIQVALHEINANLWVRNGESLNTIAQYYTGSEYCKSFMDPDLFLIQCVASQLEPDLFVRTVMERFHVFDICQDLLKTKPNKPENDLTFDENQSVAMANGALIFLAQIIQREISLDLLDKESLKNEILQFLSLDKNVFSEILHSLPSTWDWKVSTKEIGKLVNEVADFIEPDYSHVTTLKNAYYRLKGEQWEEAYDPLFYMFYRSPKDDCETTFERYAKYIKFKNLFTKSTKLWPPFRLLSKNNKNDLLKDKLNILKSRTLHAVLFTLLYQRLNSNAIKDKLYITLIYLLELAVNAIENDQVTSEPCSTTNTEGKYSETDFSNWYSSNNIIENLCETIPYIKVSREIKVEIPKEKETEQAQPSEAATASEPVKPTEEKTEVEAPAETPSEGSSEEAKIEVTEKVEEKQYRTEIKEENIPIGESILSILLKLLHKSTEKEAENADDKLDEERPKVFKLRTEVSQSRIGDEYHFISNLLTKIANLSTKCKQKIVETLKVQDGGETGSPKENSDDSDDEIRKKKEKALARQKKLLAKFSKKQKDFVENEKHDKTLKRQVSQVSFDETADEDPNAFDCCICRSSASPSFERPMGLVCLATPSSAMGLFNSVDVKINLLEKVAEEAKKPKKEEEETTTEASAAEDIPTTEEEKKTDEEAPIETTFYAKEQKRAEILKEIFTSESCRESINIGHKGGISVMTCGHYLHFDCYGEFSSENSDGKNFSCPLCRQAANFLMPVKNTLISKYKLLRLSSTNVIKENADETKHNSYEYIEQMLKADCIIDPKYLKKMMFCDNATVEGLCDSVTSQYRYLDTSAPKLNVPFHLIGDGDGILFLSSVLRTQLTVNSLQRKNTKTSTVTRSCFIPLFDVLSTRCKLLCSYSKPHLKAWNLVSKPKLEAKLDSSLKPEVAVLLRDPISMFLLVILNWPTQIYRDTYQRLVNTFFNFAFIQNLLIAVLQITTEQRKTYVLKNKNELKTLNDYVAFILQRFDNLPDDQKIVIKDPAVINDQTQLESYVKSLCLQYLRLTGLLQCYLFNEEPENNDDFESLISYLQIQYDDESQNCLLNWFDTDPVAILESWLEELVSVNSAHHTETQNLMSLAKSVYKLPQLIELPRLFTDLFSAFVEGKCKSCSSRCSNSAICLLCGKYLQNCCGVNCLSHTNECFINAGLFLYPLTGIVYIYSNNYCAKWGTLYLDEHGEADEELSRGEQMFLSEERYKILKLLWFNHKSRHQGLEWQTAWS